MESNQVNRLRRWRAATVVLAGFLALVVLVNRLEAPRDALGQVPDAGAQRERMIKEMENTNKQLGEIATLLKEIRDQRAEKPKPDPGK